MSRTRQARKRDTGFQARNPGAAKLSKVADQKVGDYAVEIIESLYESVRTGNATSAKLLFELADGADYSENAESTKRILTLAEAWAAEPRWEGDPSELEIEQTPGPRKPEDTPPQLLLPSDCDSQ